MLNCLVISLNNYTINAIKATENIERYEENQNFKSNLKARFTFLAMALIALKDIFSGIALFSLVGLLALATFCRIKPLNKINFLVLKINLQNIEVIASSLLGAVIHPLLGIKYLNRGFQKIENLNL